MPRVFLMDPQPNAFATGRDPAHGVVAVTSGILDALAPRAPRRLGSRARAHQEPRHPVATIAACVTGVITHATRCIGFMGLERRRGRRHRRSPAS